MRSNRCIGFGVPLDLAEQLQQAIGPDVIHILTQPRFQSLGYRWFRDLHTAILFTEDGASGPPEAAVDRAREEDPQIVVIALLTRRNDALEQTLLDRGCDDVVTAPICAETLAERLLLRIRRRGWSIGARETIQLYGATIDFKELQVYRNGDVAPLSRGLADLLQFFLAHTGQVVSRGYLYRTLWAGQAVDPEGKNLDVHVSKLRRLLEPAPEARKHRLIKSVYGVGYRFDPPETRWTRYVPDKREEAASTRLFRSSPPTKTPQTNTCGVLQ